MTTERTEGRSITAPALDIVGTAEIADLLGVRQMTVHSWRRRHADFPAPWRTLATGPVWRLEDIASWAQTRRPTGRPRKA